MISASTYALYRVLSIHGTISVHLSQNNRILWIVRSVQLLSLISASTLGSLNGHHHNSKFGTGATISAETYFFLDSLKFVAPKSLTSCFVLELFWCELLLSWHSVTHVARIMDSLLKSMKLQRKSLHYNNLQVTWWWWLQVITFMRVAHKYSQSISSSWIAMTICQEYWTAAHYLLVMIVAHLQVINEKVSITA